MSVLRAAATLLLLLSTPVMPAQAGEVGDRPKIGLALSGGGARGGAHIGVLEALEALEVPVDYIAGTSMGAIVGGLFAAGYSAEEIGQLVGETDWAAAFSDQPARREQTMRKKELDAEFLIPYRIGFNRGRFQFPLGVVEGQQLDQIFHRILMPVREVTEFDRLPIPFRAVATDLVSGDEVVLDSGSLPNAIRASMSVPGVFAPVRLQGRLLVDGGMANNLPVSVVREMGADIVIAVDISAPLLTEAELDSVVGVTEQITNFLTRKNTETQIASLGPNDVLLVPDLSGFSAVDFANAAAIAETGRVSALAQSEVLASLSGPAADRRGLALDSAGEAESDYIVQFIEIDNSSVLNDEIIRSRLDVWEGQPLDIVRLEASVDHIYSLDVFESVTYDLVTTERGETGVRINALPRLWGPNYLQFGLEFADAFSGNSTFKLGAAYTRNALNALGGELRIIGAFGREDELDIDFYQPIDRTARWFVEPTVFYRRQQFNVFEDEVNLARLDIEGFGGSVGVGRNFSSTNLVRLNYQYFRGDADTITGDPGFPLDDDVKIGELEMKFQHDSLDSLWFPTEGMSHVLAYRYADEGLGAAFDYDQAFASGSVPLTFGKNTFLARYEAGYSFDDKAPVERWFELGGFGRLSGLIPDQLSGRNLGLVSVAYYRRLGDIQLLPAYAGATVEAGNVWISTDDISAGDLLYSGSVFVGAETFIGPLYLAWGYSEGGQSTFYFYLGNPFRFQNF